MARINTKRGSQKRKAAPEAVSHRGAVGSFSHRPMGHNTRGIHKRVRIK